MNGSYDTNNIGENQNIFGRENIDSERVRILPMPEREASLEAERTFGAVANKGLFSTDEVVGNMGLEDEVEDSENVNVQVVEQVETQQALAMNNEDRKLLNSVETTKDGLNGAGVRFVDNQISAFNRTKDAHDFYENMRQGMISNVEKFSDRQGFLSKDKVA